MERPEPSPGTWQETNGRTQFITAWPPDASVEAAGRRKPDLALAFAPEDFGAALALALEALELDGPASEVASASAMALDVAGFFLGCGMRSSPKTSVVDKSALSSGPAAGGSVAGAGGSEIEAAGRFLGVAFAFPFAIPLAFALAFAAPLGTAAGALALQAAKKTCPKQLTQPRLCDALRLTSRKFCNWGGQHCHGCNAIPTAYDLHS